MCALTPTPEWSRFGGCAARKPLINYDTPLDAPILRATKTGACGTFAHAFLADVEAVGNMFDDVVANGPAKRVDLNVDYASDDDHFAIDTTAGAVRVRSIAYVGELQIKVTTVPILDIAEYQRLDSENPIWQVVSFAPQEMLGIKASMQFHRNVETGAIYLGFRRPPDGD